MDLKISRILHAGYLIEHDKFKVMFDPIFKNPFSGNCYAFPEIEFNEELISNLHLSAVIISHVHEDHFCLESLNLLSKDTEIYIYCLDPILTSYIRELGFNSVYEVSLGAVIQVGNICITPLPALDQDVDCIFRIDIGKYIILNVVDSWIPDFLMNQIEHTKYDLVLWPFQTMREIEVLSPSRNRAKDIDLPVELVDQLKRLQTKYIVPSSCQFRHETWSWYNEFMFPISYKFFASFVADQMLKTKLVNMLPGQTFTFQNTDLILTSEVSWIKRKGSDSVDYFYNPDVIIPNLQDFRKQFGELDATQEKRIFLFCRTELLERFKKLDPDSEPYFFKERIWKLVIVGPLQIQTYLYTVLNNQIQSTDAEFDDNEIGWVTEIMDCKLWSALESGESLTSLYIRINDRTFKDETESRLQRADFLNDPLIRILYDGNQLSYHANQMQKIRQLIPNSPS